MRRSEIHLLILCLAILFGLSISTPLDDFYGPFEGIVDLGAARTCFMLHGILEQFNPNSIEQGYKCTYTTNVWTNNIKIAQEFCDSNTPFPIIRDLVKVVDGGKTQCGFLITLQCKSDWWQIDGLCYKVIGKYTYPDAKAFCEQAEHKDTEPKLAEFYSTTLGMYLEHMSFSEAWVTVPYITEYFVNGVGEAAVFVNDGGFKYDTKQGTLIMKREDEKYPALCQYKPGMTMAEVYRRAREYEEIYPIYTHDNGINVVTSSYLTIHQKDTKKLGSNSLPKFDVTKIRERCNALGKVLDVESSPLLATELEWSNVRSYLKDHRFYLTSAFKHNGCKLTDYRDYDVTTQTEVNIFSAAESTPSVCNSFSFSFNENKRAPSMAGMRAPAICALLSYSFEQGPCETSWITFDRKGINNRFCHYAWSDEYIPYDEAKAACLEKKAALSGFDSQEEYDTVTPWLRGILYYIGAVVPCAVDCQSDSKASWEEGVARNTALLNKHGHSEYAVWWNTSTGNEIATFCRKEIHTHTKVEFEMGYVCGKYAGFTSKKIERNKLMIKI